MKLKFLLFALLAVGSQPSLAAEPASGLGETAIEPAAAVAAVRRQALQRVARRGALPGLRGFVGIDVIASEGHAPVLIEINPRLTCAYVGLSRRLGRNLAREMLGLHGLEPSHV